MLFKLEREMRDAVTRWLTLQDYLVAYEAFVFYGYADVLAGRFGERVGRRRPPLFESVIVELKLNDVKGVLQQATANRAYADWSYAAMPIDRIRTMKLSTLSRFELSGVGLLAVCPEPNQTSVMIAAKRSGPTNEHVARNLWRRVREDYVRAERRCTMRLPDIVAVAAVTESSNL